MVFLYIAVFFLAGVAALLAWHIDQLYKRTRDMKSSIESTYDMFEKRVGAMNGIVSGENRAIVNRCNTLSDRVGKLEDSVASMDERQEEANKFVKETNALVLKNCPGLMIRVEALENVVKDVGLTQESARKAAEEMERFNAGVSAILNYDGEAKRQ